MKPLTAQSYEGRVLVALRAGPLANSAVVERFGSSSALTSLIKAGYVQRADGDEGSEYRITEAGRAACPYRNPLAAPGAVRPITEKEAPMPREKGLTRNDVLNAILSTGAHGITRAALAEQFDCVGVEGRIDMHLTKLLREQPCLIARPRPGFLIAASHVPATACDQQTAKSETQATLCATGDTQAMAAGETIEITTPGDRRGPIIIEDIDSEFALFSSGRVEISDGRQTVIIRGAALAKLSDFMQVFS